LPNVQCGGILDKGAHIGFGLGKVDAVDAVHEQGYKPGLVRRFYYESITMVTTIYGRSYKVAH
jgi:hypothetical protein